MPYFTGRFDKIEDNSYDEFIKIINKLKISRYIIVFENKTKIGVKCKDHWHFILQSNLKHNTIRKLMSVLWPKNLSSIKEIPDKDVETAYDYILKQQCVVSASDYNEDELKELLEKSKNYQEEIKGKMNTEEHTQCIIDQLLKEEATDRSEIALVYFHYIYNWNKESTNAVKIHLKTGLQYIHWLHEVESKILSPETACYRWKNDNILVT